MAKAKANEFSASSRLEFHQRFWALKEEEDRIIQQGGAQERCRAYLTWVPGEELGGWVEVAASESLEARFELLAMEAGLALRPPTGTSPLNHFLKSLYLDLRASHSSHLSLDTGRACFIENLFDSCASYSARSYCQLLAEKASRPRPSSDSEDAGTRRQPRGPTPDYETAVKVAEVVEKVAPGGNWRAHLDDICWELDECPIPCPKTWKPKGLLDWTDGMQKRALVDKAIMYRLKQAARHRKTFS
jgi:hypothetical protein